MKAEERRKSIINLLLSEERAISGSELAAIHGVSRQIIVSDITVLKANGYEIISTHKGYLVQGSPEAERVFKVKHTREQTEDELTTIISCGGVVADVYVWHKVYGRIDAPLNIFSLEQVKQFIEGVRSGKSTELMNITGGYHYHTVRADSKQILDDIQNALEEKGYIVPEI